MVEMSSYERVFAFLKGRKNEADRIPCMNPAGTYTEDFMVAVDAFWPDSHFDPEKMARLGAAAHELCGLDNISIPFDILVEAELLGAPIDFREGKTLWPSVKDLIAKDFSDIKLPKDIANSGRVPVIIKAIKMLKEKYGESVPVNVIFDPPFTMISSYLMETVDFMVAIKKKPEIIHEFIDGVTPLYIELAKIYQEAGADILTYHDGGASNDSISPKYYRDFVFESTKKWINRVKSAVTILNICGNSDGIIDAMIETGATAIAIDERTSIVKTREIVDSVKPGVPILGNIPAQTLLFRGPVEKIEAAVKMVIEAGIDIVSPGCDFWIKTPAEHIKALVDSTKKYGSIQTK